MGCTKDPELSFTRGSPGGRLWTLVRPAPYEESERIMSRVLEVWSADPMAGVSEEDARTRLGEVKKLILSTGAMEVLILDVWMGKSEYTYTMVITYESAASFGKIQGEKQDGTAWKSAMKTFQANPKMKFTFGSTYFETDI